MFEWHNTKKTLFFSYCFCLLYETRKKEIASCQLSFFPLYVFTCGISWGYIIKCLFTSEMISMTDLRNDGTWAFLGKSMQFTGVTDRSTDSHFLNCWWLKGSDVTEKSHFSMGCDSSKLYSLSSYLLEAVLPKSPLFPSSHYRCKTCVRTRLF